jgi:FAD/FMN-containing dehydrogenase
MSSSSPARPTAFSTTQLQALRQQIQGRVFAVGDDGYDAGRQTWNATTFEQRPAVVVLPSSASDVVAAVAFAREYEIPIAVQGGGHGHPVPADGALLVNFADMASVRVTPAADGSGGMARVEPGARWREVISAAHALAPLNGFAATVGVVGYTLGGGVGWLVRQYGAAAGSVRLAEVVTSDGRLLQVNEHSHPDLFWQLRHCHRARVRAVSRQGGVWRFRRLHAGAGQRRAEGVCGMD